MRALYRLLDLLFPPKCVLCGRLLDRCFPEEECPFPL